MGDRHESRRCLQGLAFIAALSSTAAFAADMAVKAPPAAPPPAPTWTGFYVGGYFGGAWVTDKIVDVNGLNGGAHYTMNAFNGIGGAQGGYNYQINNIVLGLEAEYGSMVVHAKMFDPNFPGGTFSSIDGKTD